MFGPPGTGKTSYLLNKARESKLEPDNVGFFSFTKKAVKEGKSRIGGGDYPWFKTLHSLAYNQTSMSRSSFMDDKKKKDFAKWMSLDLTSHDTYDSKLLQLDELSRVKGVPLRELHAQCDDHISYKDLEYVSEGLNTWKKSNYLKDFADIIVDLVSKPKLIPSLDLLLIDEAQDISPVAWDLVRILIAKAKTTYVAGDDDQAIYGWNGASVKDFLSIKGEKIVLNQSYRLPRKVFKLAQYIVSQIQYRQPKDWNPRPEDGQLEFVTSIDECDLTKGTWYILARNRYLLEPYEDILRSTGVYYSLMNKRSVPDREMEAIRAWESLRKGGKVVYDSAKMAVKYLPQEVTVPKLDLITRNDLKISDWCPWFDAFRGMSYDERAYVRGCLSIGEDMTTEPRVKLSTIHGVKGGEAENVYLITDVSTKVYNNMGDDEHRTMYVGATRASQSLFIKQPETRKYYEI